MKVEYLYSNPCPGKIRVIEFEHHYLVDGEEKVLHTILPELPDDEAVKIFEELDQQGEEIDG